MRTLFLLLPAFFFSSFVFSQCPNGLTESYAIGPGGRFPSITCVMDTLRSGTLFRSTLQNNTIRNIRCITNGFVELVALGNASDANNAAFNSYFLKNTIGSTTSDSSIYYRRNGSPGYFYAVNLLPFNSESVLLNNNRLGGIYIDENPAGQDHVEMSLLWVFSSGLGSPWRLTVPGHSHYL